MKRNRSLILAVLMLSFSSCGRTPSVDTADSTDTAPETGIGMPQQNSDQNQTADNGQADTPPQENSGNNNIDGVPETVGIVYETEETSDSQG